MTGGIWKQQISGKQTYTVSMKVRSTRENSISPTTRMATITPTLTASWPTVTVPPPKKPLRKASTTGLSGLSETIHRYFSGTADTG